MAPGLAEARSRDLPSNVRNQEVPKKRRALGGGVPNFIGGRGGFRKVMRKRENPGLLELERGPNGRGLFGGGAL